MQNTSFEENDQTFELEQISRNKSFRIYILHTFQNLKNSISSKSNYTNFDWILKTIEKRRKLSVTAKFQISPHEQRSSNTKNPRRTPRKKRLINERGRHFSIGGGGV